MTTTATTAGTTAGTNAGTNIEQTDNLLAFDKNKVRKGKPVGLPYIGSKKKISKKIVEIIKQNFGTEKTVYDIFGGGGAITAELLLNGIDVHYNDLDKTITDMFMKVLSQDREWLKTLIVSREEFEEIKEKKNKTVDDELKLLINSFGNDRKTYLYSKAKSDIKYKLAKEIIEKEDVFGGYKQTETYKELALLKEKELGFTDKKEKHRTLQQLQRLQQLEQLGRLQQGDIKYKLQTTNKSYEYFSNLTDSIIYLDPPYENSKEYSINKANGGFDSQKFYDWAYTMSKNNVIILSSYAVSDNRFVVAHNFTKVRSTMSAQGYGNKTEKLFMVEK